MVDNVGLLADLQSIWNKPIGKGTYNDFGRLAGRVEVLPNTASRNQSHDATNDSDFRSSSVVSVILSVVQAIGSVRLPELLLK